MSLHELHHCARSLACGGLTGTFGEALVSEPATQQVTAESGDTEHTINVPPAVWLGPYTGTFFFNLRWGGQPCTTASPPVSR